MSVLLSLLSSALWGLSDFLGGNASRRVPALSVVGVSQLATLLVLVPVAVLTGGLSADRAYLLPAVLAGATGLVALTAFYRALATGTMGLVAPVAALGAVVPVVSGLVQGEAPSALQLVGVGVAVVGVVLASGPELRGGAGGVRPLLLALGAAAGFGAVLALVAEGAQTSVVMTLLTMRLTSVTALGVLLLATVRRGGADTGVHRADLPVLACVGAADVGANGAFAVASSSAGGLVSVTGVLASLYPVVTVLLARQLLGERMRRVQGVGAALTLAGVGLLSAG
ncbi:MAG: protein of unknown function transrane [Frankiales bacterium]|nr:protein of unknown function transrane [Frankiales bacterium]